MRREECYKPKCPNSTVLTLLQSITLLSSEFPNLVTARNIDERVRWHAVECKILFLEGKIKIRLIY